MDTIFFLSIICSFLLGRYLKLSISDWSAKVFVRIMSPEDKQKLMETLAKKAVTILKKKEKLTFGERVEQLKKEHDQKR